MLCLFLVNDEKDSRGGLAHAGLPPRVPSDGIKPLLGLILGPRPVKITILIVMIEKNSGRGAGRKVHSATNVVGKPFYFCIFERSLRFFPTLIIRSHRKLV